MHGGQHVPRRSTVTAALAATAEERLFRSVFGAIPSGVTVLTTMTPNGPAGMTASAVCPLSIRPQLALVCVNSGSATLRAILEHGSFAINVLDQDSAEISVAFAYYRSQPERFANVAHRSEQGLPVLADALAWAICQVHTTYPGGDHTVVVGAVSHMGRASGEPLVRHGGQYRALR
jgi:3-hydroxy-9,10-secoandrosta-1,3,5(10)-triene-9,17-dione monooxygenase reductase component